MTATQIKSVKVWHHAIIDTIIALGPNFSLQALSKETGYSVPWLSVLLNSDLFKAALSKRRATLAALVDQDVNAKLAATTNVALDRMSQLLRTAQTLEEVNSSADILLKSMGFTGKNTPQSPQTPISINVTNIAPTAVERARALIGKKNDQSLLPAPASEPTGRIIDGGENLPAGVQDSD